MICYEVLINGKKMCVAGIGDIGVLAGHVTWVKRERQEKDEGFEDGDTHIEVLSVSVSGTTHQGKDSKHLEWLSECLEVGDEVTFRIVDLESCDHPEDISD